MRVVVNIDASNHHSLSFILKCISSNPGICGLQLSGGNHSVVIQSGRRQSHGLLQSLSLLMRKRGLREIQSTAQGHQMHQCLTHWEALKKWLKYEVAQNYHLHYLLPFSVLSSIMCFLAK